MFPDIIYVDIETNAELIKKSEIEFSFRNLIQSAILIKKYGKYAKQ